MDFKTRLCSSLTKIMPLEEPPEWKGKRFSVLKGEKFSFQIACFGKVNYFSHKVLVKAQSALEKHVQIRRVENVPVDWFPENSDKDILSDKMGFFPDVLCELDEEGFFPFHRNIWNTLWIDVNVPEDWKEGKYAVKILISVPEIDPASNANYTVTGRKEFSRKIFLDVIDAKLPPADLKNAICIFPECLAEYYHVEKFSPSHWKYVEEFMKMAAKYSLNMLYTPLFPLLQEKDETENVFPSVQLIKIKYDRKNFSFDLSLLQQWISLAGKAGIKYFEFSPFFMPGKSKKTPHITIEKEGKEKELFCGNISKDLPEYEKLLSGFLPCLTAFIEKNHLQKRVYFHAITENISFTDKKVSALWDIFRKKYPFFASEKSPARKEKELIALIPEEKSHKEAKKEPLPERWLDHSRKHKKGAADLFIYSPATRNRIIGFLSSCYALDGIFLRGFNFYSSLPERTALDPYFCTSSGFSSPAGSRFLVYPGQEGKALASMRLELFFHGLQDRCALTLLETLIGREKVLKELDKAAEKGKMSMKEYPAEEEAFRKLRARINFLIRKNLSAENKQNKGK